MYFVNLQKILTHEYDEHTIYPSRENIYKAFELTPLDKIKVVLVGQDPYFKKDQAMGLSFSVPSHVKIPPSLRNIFKEIESEYGITMKKDGNLEYLARQGVLLLNTILTVRENEPLSHNIKEYHFLNKDIFKLLNSLDQPIVFILWGGYAKKLLRYLNNPLHLVLLANHPSPLSANRGGFFGCNHFQLVNEYLIKHNSSPINWDNNS